MDSTTKDIETGNTEKKHTTIQCDKATYETIRLLPSTLFQAYIQQLALKANLLI